jgi:hypothetical protein
VSTTTVIKTLGGKPINWNHPPKPTSLVLWSRKTTGGYAIKGSLRTIAHLDRLNRLSVRRFDEPISVIQSCYHTGVAASAGTHDLDACLDIWINGVDPWTQQRFLRANGFACWYRHPPLFGSHIHGFCLPEREGSSISDDFAVAGFKVGIYVDGGYSTRGGLVTSSQLLDYYNKAFGLSGMHTPGSDRSWFPDNIKSTIFDLDRFIDRRRKAAR